MKFTDLTVEGFGVWSGLELHGLSSGLNVFYGPNEAGKTTLMQFTRSMLYGFSPERRARYLPPVHGGRAGGTLAIRVPHGAFRIARFDRPGMPSSSPSSLMAGGWPAVSASNGGEVHRASGDVTVTAADGTVQGEPQLRALLGDIDESIFDRVFAVGLDEMQELRTLDGPTVARLLYDLSTGLDRVSLGDVLRELAASRVRLLAPDDGPSQIADLEAQRDKLRSELDELCSLTRRHWDLAGEREAMGQAIARAEAEVAGLDRESRVVDLALSLEDKWRAKAALDERLSGQTLSDFPPEAVARLHALRERQRDHTLRLERVRRRRRALREEAAGIKVNESLLKQAPRIHALAEHETWIAAAEQQLRDAEAALEALERQRPAHHRQPEQPQPTAAAGAKPPLKPVSKPAERTPDRAPQLPPHVSHKALQSLRGPATELRRAARAAKQSRRAAQQTQEQSKSQTQAVDQALAAAPGGDLTAAMQKAGDKVAQLRRRVQLDDRLDRMTRHRADLEEQTHQLLGKQILPLWVLAGLGSIFVVGVLMLLGGMFLPVSITGAFGWPIALLGLIAFGGAAAAKWFLETQATRHLESCRKQLTLLEAQLKQAQSERDGIDAELPEGGGPLTARLQAAEAELAKLEELMPLHAKRQAVADTAVSAEQTATQTRDALRAAHRRWQAALETVGLPKTLAPKQIALLLHQHGERTDFEKRWQDARDERDRRKRELAVMTSRIEPVFLEAELLPDGEKPSEQLRQLRRLAAEQEARATRRAALTKKLHKLRRTRLKSERALRRLERQRLALFRWARVADEDELTRRAHERSQAEEQHRRRETLHRELTAAHLGVCGEAELSALLSGPMLLQLPERRRQLVEQLQAARANLSRLFEQRGEFNQQLKDLLDDSRLGRKQLELGFVEQRLAQAVERWQVLAVTNRLLESIKHDYERNRQPETLREASEYLSRFTGGKYRRVWTPIGEETLRVDDAAGQPLSIEVLSRGTREQLFLSLRMALASAFTRRGAAMPLVLDDVLVNFDVDRSRAAAAVLRDFADAGHQVFVFTCHEHLAEMFNALGVRVRRLSSGGDLEVLPSPAPMLEREPEQPVETPRRRKSRGPKPAAEQKPPEASVEIVEAQPQLPPEPLVTVSFAVEPASPQPFITASAVAEPFVLPPLEPVLADLIPPQRVELRPRPMRRADPPHRRLVSRRVDGWWSEEFAGELDDRVAFAYSTDGGDEETNGAS